MSRQAIRLSDHFTYSRLIRFVLPSIGTMIFTSIYGVVDGLFVSNIVGKTAFAAVNLIMPYPMLMGAAGFMLGTGGSAIVAITLGEGDRERANRYFSFLCAVSAVLGVILSVFGLVTLRPAAKLMGASEDMIGLCIRYGRILMLGIPAFLLQYLLQSFFVTAEKPRLGFFVTIAAGITNMILDALLVGVFRLGVEGAAAATVCSQIVGGILPLFYFGRKNTSLLRFCRPVWDGKVLLRTCVNGSSEMMTNVSMSVVNILYNSQLMRFSGENGVAAYGVIMYANFIFIAVFVGYSVGAAPIAGFHYGAGNRAELKNIFHKSLRLIAVSGGVLTLLAVLFVPSISRVFVGYDADLLALTIRAFRIYCISFLIMGFNIYASSFFTALGNGAISALLSFLRTLLFQLASILILPELLGIDGIWLSITAAETAALAVSIAMFLTQNKKYGYR